MAIFDKDNNRLPPTTIQKPPPHEEEVIPHEEEVIPPEEEVIPHEEEEKEPLKQQDLGYFYDKILEKNEKIKELKELL